MHFYDCLLHYAPDWSWSLPLSSGASKMQNAECRMEPKKVANSWRVSAAMTGLTGRNSLGLFHCLGPTAIVIVFWQLQLQVLGLQLELDCRRTGFRNTRLSPFTLPKK